MAGGLLRGNGAKSTTHPEPDLPWGRAVPLSQTHSPEEAGAARGEQAQAKKGFQMQGRKPDPSLAAQ